LFAGKEAAFADSLVRCVADSLYHRAMRVFYPGQVVLPLLFILGEALFLMSRFDIVRVGWPVALIAAGLEELYLWTTRGDDK
jgi:hypothetical protein